jgi:hypothetical protein
MSTRLALPIGGAGFVRRCRGRNHGQRTKAQHARDQEAEIKSTIEIKCIGDEPQAKGFGPERVNERRN